MDRYDKARVVERGLVLTVGSLRKSIEDLDEQMQVVVATHDKGFESPSYVDVRYWDATRAYVAKTGPWFKGERAVRGLDDPLADSPRVLVISPAQILPSEQRFGGGACSQDGDRDPPDSHTPGDFVPTKG